MKSCHRPTRSGETANGRDENEFERYPNYSDSDLEIEEIPKFQIKESFDSEKLQEKLRKKAKRTESLAKGGKEEGPSEESLPEDIRETFYFSEKLYKFVLANAKRIKHFRLYMRLKREDIDKGFHQLNAYSEKMLQASAPSDQLILENPLMGIKKPKIKFVAKKGRDEEGKIQQIRHKK